MCPHRPPPRRRIVALPWLDPPLRRDESDDGLSRRHHRQPPRGGCCLVRPFPWSLAADPLDRPQCADGGDPALPPHQPGSDGQGPDTVVREAARGRAGGRRSAERAECLRLRRWPRALLEGSGRPVRARRVPRSDGRSLLDVSRGRRELWSTGVAGVPRVHGRLGRPGTAPGGPVDRRDRRDLRRAVQSVLQLPGRRARPAPLGAPPVWTRRSEDRRGARRDVTKSPVRLAVSAGWFRPGFRAGGPIRSLDELCRALGDGFEAFVLARDHDLGGSSYPEVERDRWVDWEGAASVWYFSRHNLGLQQVRDVLAGIRPDCIYLNSVFSIPFTVLPLRASASLAPRPRMVLAPRGSLHPGALRTRTLKKRLYLLGMKLLGVHRDLVFHATDEREADDIRRIFGSGAEVHRIPNLARASSGFVDPPSKTPGRLEVGVLGRIVPKKNLAYLLERVGALRSEVTVRVAGPEEDSGYVQRCRRIARGLPPHVRVEWLGPVAPEDVGSFLGRNHVIALPTLGENHGHTVFEALSVGRPVLISDQTPWLDLERRNAGWDLPLDRPEAFQRTLERLASMDGEALAVWCRGARRFAEDRERLNRGAIDRYRDLFRAGNDANAPPRARRLSAAFDHGSVVS
ncbi:MAG: glycosyltransferase [Acidobacteria bacterium]|nr:MAG: glycosyltransferase [Acidobacteriota bacterium]